MKPLTSLFLAAASNAIMADATRPMESLGRGVVAVRVNDTAAHVSWRLLGLDDSSIGFNLYRNDEKINGDVLTGGTSFMDLESDISDDNEYHVRPVLNGEEQDASGSFNLAADTDAEPVVRVPIKSGGAIKNIWVGDLDGDGEYDFVVDRQTAVQAIEAYRNNGEFLWEVSLGPNSENQDNIEPGSSTIDVGHWDGVTVYDMDSDGYAEVLVRIANGVVFGDGAEFSDGETDDDQFIAVLDGRTGALLATATVPDNYIEDGPLGARLGVGYLDGVTPHVAAFFKNRQDDGPFNILMAAWTFDGDSLSEAWVYDGGVSDSYDAGEGHNTRIIDVDGDGIDEVGEISWVLEGNGSLRYSLSEDGILHGDRWHVAKMDPSRDGLQGYGVQQDNEDLIYEYYYDATNGEVLWKHTGDTVADIGRGMAGDIDPRYDGMEVWSFSGIYNAATDKITNGSTEELEPWPQLGIWWDGDILMELYNDGKIEKWNYEEPTDSGSLDRLEDIGDYGATSIQVNPPFLGDIWGDWREEVILVNSDYDELIIFTTDIPTDNRLYTLTHNPAYRNAITLKGYVQSSHVDYFLGEGMETPPTPDIEYVPREKKGNFTNSRR